MSDSLYENLILDHNKHPRNFGLMEAPTLEGDGNNPLCGDHLIVYLLLEEDSLSQVQFSGSGCAIAKASASLMTCAVVGKTCLEAQRIAQRFEQMLTGPSELETVDFEQELGALGAFASLRRYPMRLKCALLPWRALGVALAKKTGMLKLKGV